MKSYRVSRRIAASQQTVWSLLTNAATYADWNPAVLGIEGEIGHGQTIRLTSIVNPDRQFRLRVSDVDAPRRMVWSDGMPLGLFRGVRSFELRSHGEDVTEFTMEEIYSGPMAPLITRSIPDLTGSFEMFADGLKEAAESR